MSTRIFAWDFSGSTDSITHYHTLGKRYVNAFRAKPITKKGTKLRYLLWNDNCFETNSDNLDKIIENKIGAGGSGTNPSAIIHWIKKHVPPSDYPIHLWLMTDGEIDDTQQKQCINLNLSMTYASVKFIIINTNRIDMSVGASFICNTAVKIYINEQHFKTINCAGPFFYDTITIDNFHAKWPELMDYIQAKFMGSDWAALEESKALGHLRKRLLAEKTPIDPNNKENPNPTLFQSTKSADLINGFKNCQFYELLRNPNLKDIRCQIDGMVSSLINYIHNKHKSFNFNEIKIDYKTTRLEEVKEEEPILQTFRNLNNFNAVTFEGQLDEPLIFLSVHDIISQYWENGSYSKFRTVIDCPLFASLKGISAQVTSHRNFINLRDNDLLPKNLINDEIVGGLSFSVTAEADAWNDYVLAHIFFRRKKVSSDFSIWYYVIWKHFENAEWIESEFRLKMKAYAFRRLESMQVPLTFSSLPLDPKERVSVPVACFYCTEGSARLFGEDKQLFAHERLRKFSRVVNQMIEILDYFGFTDLDRNFIQERAKTLSIVGELQRIPNIVDKRYHLATKVFQPTADDRFLTYEIKNKEALKYFHLLRYNHKGVIPFQFELTQVDLSDHVLFGYCYKKVGKVDICTRTYRPYFVVSNNSGKKVSNFAQILQCISQVTLGKTNDLEFTEVTVLKQTRLVSEYNLYIKLTEELKKFPTLTELTNYVARVKKVKRQRIFLFPPNICEIIESAYKTYGSLEKVPRVKTFLKIVKNGASIENRIKAEGRMNDKLEMKEFRIQAKQLIKKVKV